MPALLSHYRPDDQIFTFTENRAVQRRLALYHGVTALHMRFGETADETFDRCALPCLDYLGDRTKGRALAVSFWCKGCPAALKPSEHTWLQCRPCNPYILASNQG